MKATTEQNITFILVFLVYEVVLTLNLKCYIIHKCAVYLHNRNDKNF